MQIFHSGAKTEQKRRESAEVTDCKANCYNSYQIANFLHIGDLWLFNGIHIG